MRTVKIGLLSLTIIPLFSACLNMTDGYQGEYLIPTHQGASGSGSSGGSNGNVFGAGPVGVPPTPSCTPSTPVNDGTNFRSYWNGMETAGGTCATGTNSFKRVLQERVRNPHRVLYYTTHSTPKPVGFSDLPSGFSNPPSSESSQKASSLTYLDNMNEWVVKRFNVWDAFTAIALKGVNQNNSTATLTCATDKIYDYYGGNCMSPPGNIGFPRMFNEDSTLKNSEGSISGCGPGCNLIYNREHSWPKSWFAAGSTSVNNPSAGSYCYNGNNDGQSFSTNNWDYRAHTDLHHMRPTAQQENSTRGNNAYGIVNGGSFVTGEGTTTYTTNANPATGGKSGTPHFANISAAAAAATGVGTTCNSILATVCPTTATCKSAAPADISGCPESCVPPTATSVWEPPDHMKGNLARNYFYMATRYYTEDTCWSSSDATSKAHLKLWTQCLLLRWHQQDPPDAQEVALNDLIHRIQGNRNPFVDHPEWVATVVNNGGF
jgi:endonuclease I